LIGGPHFAEAAAPDLGDERVAIDDVPGRRRRVGRVVVEVAGDVVFERRNPAFDAGDAVFVRRKDAFDLRTTP
jgi:hypothetical protein